ncbi:MAG: glutaredoxin family protein [bacterium]|nr:glutaredoxin family protein [bacterium]
MAKSVKIYSTPTCTYCKMAKDFFQKSGVKYDEVDVSADMDARKEMVEKSHQLGVPVIDVEGEIFVGFNRSELAKALGIK